jgi:phosphotransferase system  glucose/maltose/N-acetylglucosamine-specific IIC component
MVFGQGGEGLAVYVVLEQERRVVVVSVTWVG